MSSDPNNCEKVSETEDGAPHVRSPLSKRKQHKKLVRLLTVMAYVFSVSLGAIVLSLYYVFLWDPQIQRDGGGGVRRGVAGTMPRPMALAVEEAMEEVLLEARNESTSTEDGVTATVVTIKASGE